MSRVTTEFTALTYVTSGSHIKVGSYWVNNWGLFLLNPGMIKVLIVKSILLLEESLHRVTDPGSWLVLISEVNPKESRKWSMDFEAWVYTSL